MLPVWCSEIINIIGDLQYFVTEKNAIDIESFGY